MSDIKILSQYFATVLEKDTTVDGEVIPAGTTVLFAPQTTAHSVRVPGSKSLLEAWPEISKTNHTHPDLLKILVGYQSELIKAMDRLTKLEIWATKNGYQAEEDNIDE